MKTVQDLKDWLHANGYHAGLGDIIRMEQDPVYAANVECKLFRNRYYNSLRDIVIFGFTWRITDLGHSYWDKIYETSEKAYR